MGLLATLGTWLGTHAAGITAASAAAGAGAGVYGATQMKGPPKPIVRKEAPVATPESGEDGMDLLRSRKRRSGRADTIVAGDLIPMDAGRKTLLG